MIIILATLYATCYMLFFRTIDVNVTENVTLRYRGENASASVEVMNDKDNYNDRIREFMDTIQYSIEPSSDLKNGDTITLKAMYDEDLAKRYHLQPINLEREFIVENLPERLQDQSQLTPEFLNILTKRSESYLKKNMRQILDEDFTSFHLTAQPKLVSSENVYRIFLDAKDKKQKDKVVDIYKITAKGEMNVAAEGQQLEVKESAIYYMITYNEMNTALSITDETVYGEKVIIGDNVDLMNTDTFQTYLKSKYHDQYMIAILP